MNGLMIDFVIRYLLNGDSSELGSTQNPTNAWKNSTSSCNGVVLTITRRYALDKEQSCRRRRDRIEWHCVRRNSAGGPRMPVIYRIIRKIL